MSIPYKEETFEPDHFDFPRSSWGPGPWDKEPDKIQWQDDKTGLACLIVRNGSGALCGYVGVPLDHDLAMVDYGEWKRLEALHEAAHAGLTFSKGCDPGGKICHVTEPAEEVWWFGFDCAHAYDLSPGMEAFRRERGLSSMGEEYRDVPYVKSVCAKLAIAIRETETS